MEMDVVLNQLEECFNAFLPLLLARTGRTSSSAIGEKPPALDHHAAAPADAKVIEFTTTAAAATDIEQETGRLVEVAATWRNQFAQTLDFLLRCRRLSSTAKMPACAKEELKDKEEEGEPDDVPPATRRTGIGKGGDGERDGGGKRHRIQPVVGLVQSRESSPPSMHGELHAQQQSASPSSSSVTHISSSLNVTHQRGMEEEKTEKEALSECLVRVSTRVVVYRRWQAWREWASMSRRKRDADAASRLLSRMQVVSAAAVSTKGSSQRVSAASSRCSSKQASPRGGGSSNASLTQDSATGGGEARDRVGAMSADRRDDDDAETSITMSDTTQAGLDSLILQQRHGR